MAFKDDKNNAVLAALFYRDVKPGQVYIHRDHLGPDPFRGDKMNYGVTVINVKDRYVQYKWKNLGTDSLRIDSFNFTFILKE